MIALTAVIAQLAAATVASADTLSFQEFFRRVATAHPVVREARLVGAAAAADVTAARGAFEPSLAATWDKKEFKGIGYFDEFETKLTVPTPFGADLMLGYERALGQIINPERATPSRGLTTLGIRLPIGQRMLTDERRTTLAVAKAVRDATDGERLAMVNKVLLSAAKEYGRWYEASERERIAVEGESLAAFRLDAVRRRVQGGDAPAIDTIEAQLEVDRRAVGRIEAEALRVTQQLLVAAYLWQSSGEPITPPTSTRPGRPDGWAEPLDSARMAAHVARATALHPAVRKAEAKSRAARSQRLLALQQLLPAGSLDIGTLALAGERADLLDVTGASDNYKAGASVKVNPLLFKERGKLAAARSKADQAELELATTRRDVEVSVRVAANELESIEQQVTRQAIAVTRARSLRDGEQRRFDAGESSLLIINLRERLLLDEQAKLAALEGKRVSARVGLQVAIGDPLTP